MRKLFVLTFAVVFALGGGSGSAAAEAGASHPAPAWAGTCGLPQATPLWVEYGWPAYAQIFGRPGVVVAGSTGGFPAQMRAAGAGTVYFDLYLKNRVGQPATPADPATIVDKANKLYDFAVQQMGCADPTIVENELFGAGLVTPWSDTNAQYRQNVLTFLQQLAARGAHPVLLVNSKPYTAGDAATWWQQVAAVADIVREDYVPATLTWKLGPIVGNRTLRTAYRTSITDFTSIGIPPQRLGIMVSFATTKGFGGRNGLEPLSAWLQVAKWQALSAAAIASETGIGSVWSWGWAMWNAHENDPSKLAAACVWLWAHDPGLCDGPGAAGPQFDASRTEGQIRLSPGTQCTVGKRAVSTAAIRQLESVTGDWDTAFSALYERVVESAQVPIATKTTLAAERALISEHFGGSRAAYAAALAKAHVPLTVARAAIADQLRRATVSARLQVGAPTAAAVKRFYESYPDLLVRRVKTKRGAPWLGGRREGLILSATAPDQLFRGGKRTVWTLGGAIVVRPEGDAVPLGSVALDEARPGIAAALRTFARGEAFERWSERQQKSALDVTTCLRDALPQPAAVELTTFVPFLQLAL